MGKSGKRSDYEYNHARLTEAYRALLKERARKPTIAELAAATGLGTTAVERHLKDLKFEPAKHPARFLTDDVINSIYVSAMKGRSRSQELWLQVLEGWSAKQQETPTETTRLLFTKLDHPNGAWSSDAPTSDAPTSDA